LSDTEIDLEAIIERDRHWLGEPTTDCPEADRRALLEHVTELEAITEEIMADLRAIKALVPAHKVLTLPESMSRRAEYKNNWARKNRLSAPQWRMLEELSESNKNPENEWSFPHKNLRTGQKLRRMGLAKEHDHNAHRCCFSITAAGRERIAQRKNPDGKIASHEDPGDALRDPPPVSNSLP